MPANIFKQGVDFLRPILLPLLVAVLPALYHYGNNVEKLTSSSLGYMLVFHIILALLFYFIFGVFNKFQSIKTVITTFVFLVFYNIYGLLYKFLITADIFRIKHYTFLPLVLMIAIYLAWFLSELKPSFLGRIVKSCLFIVVTLVAFNVMKIIPTEASRWNNRRSAASLETPIGISQEKTPPDIYYIIFDEFAGFQAMREYWQYNEINEFAGFLQDQGFFIAENSHGSSIDTLHQMATRLNYHEYPLEDKYIQTYFNDIADNRVMHFLKSRGYTTVVFDETNMGYPSTKSIHADYLYEYGSSLIPQSRIGEYGIYFDEFGEMVISNTMFYAFSEEYEKNNPTIHQHRNMIYFTVDHIADKNIPSPKFVYVHLLLPHSPFRFDQNGDITDNDHSFNWNYYLENYMFSIKIAKLLVENILSASDPSNPPIIILQSDHGARNILSHNEDSAILPNYPEKFKTLVMYALYMPGYDTSRLPQDVNPANTFPIVFNYLFDANITLMK